MQRLILRLDNLNALVSPLPLRSIEKPCLLKTIKEPQSDIKTIIYYCVCITRTINHHDY